MLKKEKEDKKNMKVMNIKEWDNFLASNTIFNELEPSIVRLLVSCSAEATFLPGEIIIKAGDKADKFFLIKEGSVSVGIKFFDRNKIIDVLKEGNILGWAGVVAPFEESRFNCKAIEKTTVFVFNGKMIREKCEKIPGLAFKLLKHFSEILTERLYHTRLSALGSYRL
ncbi:cyclic nucleotide-binding domain-containing protein [Candidatus Riflebacteria bacterium]